MTTDSRQLGQVQIGLRLDEGRTRVLVALNRDFAFVLGWEAADKLARGLAAAAIREPVGELPAGFRVVAEGAVTERADVLLEGPGAKAVLLPQHAASAIGGHLLAAARRCEEQYKAEQIAHDQATLLRVGGIPLADGGRLRLGLTDNPQIQDLAGQMAAHDPQLRRYLPGGVQARAHFPLPGVFDAAEVARARAEKGQPS